MKKRVVLSDEEFSLFQKFFVEQSGLYFDKDRINSLEGALKQRLEKKGYNTYAEYYHFLKFHPEGPAELKELLDLVTIGETFFFRNSPQFSVLSSGVMPEIIEKKRKKEDYSIRIWSAGCSKGDEPYSIAITVLELLPDYMRWNISILGTEINRNVLSCAKSGLYTKKDIGSMPAEYLNKYFEVRGTNFILNDKVKQMVRFEYHNLSKDAFGYEPMQQLDIIFCRNVIIYFSMDTIKKVMNNFYDCLVPEGYLFLGHSETLWNINDRFEAIEFPRTFIYKKPSVDGAIKKSKPFIEVPEFDLEEPYSFFSSKPSEEIFESETEGRDINAVFGVEEILPERKKEVDAIFENAVKAFNEKRYEEADLLCGEVIEKDGKNAAAFFLKSNICANCGRYYEAIDILKNIIAMDNLHLESYYMLGVMASKMTDYDNAVRYFKKAVYIDPDLELAYYNLANISLFEKKYSQAEKYFINALELLGKKTDDEKIKFGEDFTVDFLIRACKNNLAELNKRG